MLRKNEDTFPKEDLRDFCAPGATFTDEMIRATENVALRVIRFDPPVETRYPPVVFVPGWVSLIFGWKEVLQEMTRDFKIYYIETREKISSVVQGKLKYDVESIGLDIVSLIEKLDLKNREFILLGSSLGGTTILDMYRYLQRKPLCAILVGPNAVFRIPGIWIFIVRLFYPGLYEWIKPPVKWYLRKFRLDVNSDYAQYEKYCRAIDAGDPWKLKKGVLSLYKYEVWPLLPAIDMPVLIIGASKDKLHEPDNLHKMVRVMPQATYRDMGTNKETHSREMVSEIRTYLDRLRS